MKYALIVIMLVLVGCGEAPIPKFKVGEMVQTVLTGHVGMVTIVRGEYAYPHCKYAVRFPTVQIATNTRTLKDDEPITFMPISLIKCMGEWELTKAKER